MKNIEIFGEKLDFLSVQGYLKFGKIKEKCTLQLMVSHCTKEKTVGGLKKANLKRNRNGKVVS